MTLSKYAKLEVFSLECPSLMFYFGLHFFSVWLEYRDRIVGFYHRRFFYNYRYHSYNYEYMQSDKKTKNDYSFVLIGCSFFSKVGNL